MSNWRKFEIEVYNKELADLGIDDNEKSVAYIDLDKVVAFFDVSDESGPRQTTFKFSGDNQVTVYAHIEDIRKLINNAGI